LGERGLVTHFCLSALTHALIGCPLHTGQDLPLKKCHIIRKWEVTWEWFVLQGLIRHLIMKFSGLHLLSFYVLLMTAVHFCWRCFNLESTMKKNSKIKPAAMTTDSATWTFFVQICVAFSPVFNIDLFIFLVCVFT